MPTRSLKLRLSDQIAKLHLEPGDALIVDARVFDTEAMRFTHAPRDVRIFPVILADGQSVRDAFTTVHAMELESLTRTKLTEMMRVFLGNCGGHASAIIDGIEADCCDCDNPEVKACYIHERCASLRYLLREHNLELARDCGKDTDASL